MLFFRQKSIYLKVALHSILGRKLFENILEGIKPFFQGVYISYKIFLKYVNSVRDWG